MNQRDQMVSTSHVELHGRNPLPLLLAGSVCVWSYLNSRHEMTQVTRWLHAAARGRNLKAPSVLHFSWQVNRTVVTSSRLLDSCSAVLVRPCWKAAAAACTHNGTQAVRLRMSLFNQVFAGTPLVSIFALMYTEHAFCSLHAAQYFAEPRPGISTNDAQVLNEFREARGGRVVTGAFAFDTHAPEDVK